MRRREIRFHRFRQNNMARTILSKDNMVREVYIGIFWEVKGCFVVAFALGRGSQLFYLDLIFVMLISMALNKYLELKTGKSLLEVALL